MIGRPLKKKKKNFFDAADEACGDPWAVDQVHQRSTNFGMCSIIKLKIPSLQILSAEVGL